MNESPSAKLASSRDASNPPLALDFISIKVMKFGLPTEMIMSPDEAMQYALLPTTTIAQAEEIARFLYNHLTLNCRSTFAVSA